MHQLFISQCDAASVAHFFLIRTSIFNLFVSSINDESSMTVALLMIELCFSLLFIADLINIAHVLHYNTNLSAESLFAIKAATIEL